MTRLLYCSVWFEKRGRTLDITLSTTGLYTRAAVQLFICFAALQLLLQMQALLCVPHSPLDNRIKETRRSCHKKVDNERPRLR